ncbi:ester cyclase [Bacillus paranthracis]|uniref:ester cyclase n=1 Tax=Bacillus paranthracis TaxID=2026186 RepID=UPI003556AEE8
MGVKKLFGFLSLFVICILLVACGVEGKTEVQLLKEMPKAKTMTIDPSLSKMEATEIVHAAQRFYTFWDTGKEELLSQTVTKDFFDNTLPKERPQGVEGLKFAAQNFRKVVPNIHCEIEDLLVVGDKVTTRLSFTGTHNGKNISFSAIDILHVKDGKITEDWHLEDNLTLKQQLGLINEE